MTIWKDIAVLTWQKIPHARKIGGKAYGGFNSFFGDVPVIRWNEVTDKIEPVVNLRGRAYAARKRFAYRKRKA